MRPRGPDRRRKTVQALEASLRRLGSPARAAGEKAYHKSRLNFFGVGVPDIRRSARSLARELPDLTRRDLRELAERLFATDWHELRSVAIALLERRRDLLAPADLAWLSKLVRRSPYWAHVDWLAVKVIGPLTTSSPRGAATLRRWAGDPDLWIRRTSLLAQLDELRAGRGDFELFTALAAPLLPEKDFFIRKAIGWVLREVSRRRPELTVRFLAVHGADASGVTWREATRHLPPRLQRGLVPGRAQRSRAAGRG